jgi:hypothetical protein
VAAGSGPGAFTGQSGRVPVLRPAGKRPRRPPRRRTAGGAPIAARSEDLREVAVGIGVGDFAQAQLPLHHLGHSDLLRGLVAHHGQLLGLKKELTF